MGTRLRSLSLGLLTACGVALVLRAIRLGSQSLWIDELISLQLATYAQGREFWRGLLIDIHGPFNSAILHGWTAWGGTGEAWLRSLYVIPAVATVPVVWQLGRELFDAGVGLGSAWILACSPFHVWYSQEVRSYSWAILWTALVLLLFVRAWDRRAGAKTWLGLGGLVPLALLTNFSAVFLVAGLTAAILIRRPFDAALARSWAAILVVSGLAFLPWFLDWYGRIGGERIFVDAPSTFGVPLREASGFSWTEVPYVLWSFVFGYSLGPPLRELHLDRTLPALVPYFPVIALGAFAIAIPLSAGVRAARDRGRLSLIGSVAGVALVLAIVLAARNVKTYHPRYLIAFFPLLLVVLGAGWAARPRLGRTSLVAAAALAALSLGQLWFDPAYAKEDSRSAARLILANERPGDSVVVIYAYRPFRHYYADTAGGRAPIHHAHKRFLRTDEELAAHVSEARTDANRVWLVLSRWWDVAPEARIRRAFEGQLTEAGRWEFPGVKVTLYEGRHT